MTPKKTINIRNLKVKRIDKIYNVNSPYIKILSINNEYFFLIDRFPILKIEKTKLKISKAGLIYVKKKFYNYTRRLKIGAVY